MIGERRNQLISLEGRQVDVALQGGSRVDDCQLVSAGRTGIASIWLYTDGADTFVQLDDVMDIWEVSG